MSDDRWWTIAISAALVLLRAASVEAAVKINEIAVAASIPDAERDATVEAARAFYDFWNTGNEIHSKHAIAAPSSIAPCRRAVRGARKDQCSRHASSAARYRISAWWWRRWWSLSTTRLVGDSQHPGRMTFRTAAIYGALEPWSTSRRPRHLTCTHDPH
jgi:hypothetical protein